MNESGKNFNIQDEQIIQLLKEKGFMPYVYNLETKSLNLIDNKNLNQFNTLFIKDLKFVEERILNCERLKVGSLVL